jgi:hypothetical protein
MMRPKPKQAQRDAESKAWQGKLNSYAKARASLKVHDYEDAEAVALEAFSITQQGIVIQGSDNPALIIYALGKNACAQRNWPQSPTP